MVLFSGFECFIVGLLIEGWRINYLQYLFSFGDIVFLIIILIGKLVAHLKRNKKLFKAKVRFPFIGVLSLLLPG